jgi:hypothetical protein
MFLWQRIEIHMWQVPAEADIHVESKFVDVAAVQRISIKWAQNESAIKLRTR